jgi:hypothetical protein
MIKAELDLAQMVNFDSSRPYRWLVSIPEPNPKLYAFRTNDVDLDHVINLLQGHCPLSVQLRGPDRHADQLVNMGAVDPARLVAPLRRVAA